MDEFLQREILNELRMIKKLLAQDLVTGNSQMKQIEKLSSIGFPPKEISDILGATPNTVNVTLSRIRRTRRKSAGS